MFPKIKCLFSWGQHSCVIYKESSIPKERNAFIIGGNGLSVGGYTPEGSILLNIGLALDMQKSKNGQKKKTLA